MLCVECSKNWYSDEQESHVGPIPMAIHCHHEGENNHCICLLMNGYLKWAMPTFMEAGIVGEAILSICKYCPECGRKLNA